MEAPFELLVDNPYTSYAARAQTRSSGRTHLACSGVIENALSVSLKAGSAPQFGHPGKTRGCFPKSHILGNATKCRAIGPNSKRHAASGNGPWGCFLIFIPSVRKFLKEINGALLKGSHKKHPVSVFWSADSPKEAVAARKVTALNVRAN